MLFCSLSILLQNALCDPEKKNNTADDSSNDSATSNADKQVFLK
jgi:hypothetical protein